MCQKYDKRERENPGHLKVLIKADSVVPGNRSVSDKQTYNPQRIKYSI